MIFFINEVVLTLRRAQLTRNTLAALAFVSGSLGCSTTPSEVKALTSDPAVASFLRHADTQVVILMDPSQCVSCNSAIGELQQWSRGERRSFLVVVSRPASPAELLSLRAARLFPAVVLAQRARPLPEPIALVFVSATLIDSAAGQSQLLDLVDKLRH